MARTLQQIFDLQISAKNQQPNLSGITSTSQTAIYKLIFQTVATIISTFEQILDLHKEDIQYIKDTTEIQNGLWWKDKMLNLYQYDPLNTDSGVIYVDPELYTYNYKVVNPDFRIVKYCSVTANQGLCTIKVAKQLNNLPTQLSLDEQQSAFSFVQNIQDLGYNVQLVSFNADSVKISANIFYDGQYILSNIQNNVETAIANYFTLLNFDGAVLTNDLIEYVREHVQGIKDFYITDFQGKPDSGTYQPIIRMYPTLSGYVKLDTANCNYTYTIQK